MKQIFIMCQTCSDDIPNTILYSSINRDIKKSSGRTNFITTSQSLTNAGMTKISAGEASARNVLSNFTLYVAFVVFLDKNWTFLN